MLAAGGDPLLDQAKSRLKVLEDLPPIPPEPVLDAIERDLERGRLMVFPDRNSKIAYWMRLRVPDVIPVLAEAPCASLRLAKR